MWSRTKLTVPGIHDRTPPRPMWMTKRRFLPEVLVVPNVVWATSVVKERSSVDRTGGFEVGGTGGLQDVKAGQTRAPISSSF